MWSFGHVTLSGDWAACPALTQPARVALQPQAHWTQPARVDPPAAGSLDAFLIIIMVIMISISIKHNHLIII